MGQRALFASMSCPQPNGHLQSPSAPSCIYAEGQRCVHICMRMPARQHERPPMPYSACPAQYNAAACASCFLHDVGLYCVMPTSCSIARLTF